MESYSHEQICYETETGMRYSLCGVGAGFTADHWHNGLEIIYQLTGKLTVCADGTEYELLPGGFIVINSKSIHSVLFRQESRHLLLQIPYELLRRNIPDIDILRFDCVCLGEPETNEGLLGVRDCLERLAELYSAPREDSFLLAFNALVYSLLYRLVKGFKSAADPKVRVKTEKNIERLGFAVRLVRQNYAQSISLADAAKAASLNREYFARFFRRYMGMTFMEYVCSVRLEHAYSDILKTDLTIGTIAEKNGFGNNYKLFVRKFREQYGCAPSQLRKGPAPQPSTIV